MLDFDFANVIFLVAFFVWVRAQRPANTSPCGNSCGFQSFFQPRFGRSLPWRQGKIDQFQEQPNIEVAIVGCGDTEIPPRSVPAKTPLVFGFCFVKFRRCFRWFQIICHFHTRNPLRFHDPSWQTRIFFNWVGWVVKKPLKLGMVLQRNV